MHDAATNVFDANKMKKKIQLLIVVFCVNYFALINTSFCSRTAFRRKIYEMLWDNQLAIYSVTFRFSIELFNDMDTKTSSHRPAFLRKL